MLVNIYMKFHEDILNGFQITEPTRFRDSQTDGQMPGQMTGANTICLPTLKGGDIITQAMLRTKSNVGVFGTQGQVTPT